MTDDVLLSSVLNLNQSKKVKEKFLFNFPLSSCSKSKKMEQIVIISLFAFITVQSLSSENRQTSSTGDLIIHEVGGFQFPLEHSATNFESRSIAQPLNGAHDQDIIHGSRFTNVFKMFPNWLKFSKNTPIKIADSAPDKGTKQ